MNSRALDPVEIKLATLLGEWFAEALQRSPTKAEIGIVLEELGKVPAGASTTNDIAAAMDRAAARLGVPSPHMP